MLIVDVRKGQINANPEHSVLVRGWHSVVLGWPVVLRVVCFVFWIPCGTEGWHLQDCMFSCSSKNIQYNLFLFFINAPVSYMLPHTM